MAIWRWKTSCVLKSIASPHSPNQGFLVPGWLKICPQNDFHIHLANGLSSWLNTRVSILFWTVALGYDNHRHCSYLPIILCPFSEGSTFTIFIKKWKQLKKKKNTAHRISILSTVTLTFCSHYWMPHALASAALLKRTVSHLGVTYSPEFRRLSSPFISLWGNLCLVMGISHYSLGTVILSKKCLLNAPR